MDREAIRAKAAELRRYEGRAEPVGRHGAFELFSPFGPQIARSRLDPVLVARLNAHGDRVVGSQPGREFALPPDLVWEGGDAGLLRTAERLVAGYVEALHGQAPRAVEIEIFWIVSQPAGSPSPIHFHSSAVAGVGYLKVPELEEPEREAERTYTSGRQAGYINFLTGGRQDFARSVASFRPVVGDVYLFPGWLLHGAEPFRGSGERRSFAFNASVALA